MILGRLRRWRRPAPTAPCPVRALCDQLAAEGWTVAFPFPVPDACHGRTCQHQPDNAWATAYAARGRRIAQAVEDGRPGDWTTYAALVEQWRTTLAEDDRRVR